MPRALAGVLAVSMLLLPAMGAALPVPRGAGDWGGEARVVPMTRDEMESLRAPAAAPPLPPPLSGGSLSPVPLPGGLLQNDCGSMGDAPASGEGAVPVAPPVECVGTLAWDDERDAYRFDAARGDVLDVGVTFYDPYRVRACLVAPSGARPACAWGLGPLRWTANETGAWSVEVAWQRASWDWWGGDDYVLRLVLAPPSPPDDCGTGRDAGGSAGSAVAFAAPGACAGEVNSELDEEDALAFAALRGQAFHVTLASRAYPSVCLYGPDGESWLDCGQAVHPPERGPVRTSELYFEPPADGTYHLRVVARSGAGSGPYVVSLAATEPQDDCGTGSDASGYAVPDAALEVPAACIGVLAIPVADDFDAYVFDAPSALRVTLAAPGVRATLCLLNPSGEFGACAFAREAGEPLSFPYQAPEGGRWEVWIWAPFAPRANASYELGVSAFAPTPQDDCGTGRDAADDWDPHPHVASIDCEGQLLGTEGDYRDLYSFDTTGAGNVTVSATGAPGKLLQVCLTGGPWRWRCAEGNGAASVRLPAGGPVHWHVLVSSFEESDGAYRLALDAQPA